MKKKPKPSERTLFERWWRSECDTITAAELRELRTEGGYSRIHLDYAWIGWCARATANVETTL